MIVEQKTLNELSFIGFGKYWTIRFYEPYADWQETYKWYKNREKFSQIRKVRHRNKKRYRRDVIARRKEEIDES